MPQNNFFGGMREDEKVCCLKATRLCISSLENKKKGGTASNFFFYNGFFLLFLINFKWLFVTKLLLFQARIHLSAFARIKSAPNGKQISATSFLSAWNLQ